MNRIPPLDPPYDDGLAAALAAMMPPGVEPIRLFRTLARNPRVLSRIRGGNLLDRGSITAREREIVILRTCARTGSEYEWGVHAAFFAGRVGLGERELVATVHGAADDACWTPAEALLLRLADELHDTAHVSDSLWSALGERYEDAQLVELLVLAGFYHAIAYVTNGARIELEEFGARFPERPPAA